MGHGSRSSGGSRKAYIHLWRNLDLVDAPLPKDPRQWDLVGEPGTLPSPWTVWTLICLFRQRARQLWVANIVTGKLGGDLEEIGTKGYLGHPESRPQAGPVPGLPEWEYLLHGTGCRLTHRVTGEEVDVDFCDAGAEYFDIFFYLNYLRSLKHPQTPERRLIELHPSLDPIRLAFNELQDDGLLESYGDGHVVRLTEDVLTNEPAVDRFCLAWEEVPRRPWLSALIGDWMYWEMPGLDVDQALRPLAVARAAATRDQRSETLRAELDGPVREAHAALSGLADIQVPDLPNLLTDALRNPVPGLTTAAIDVLGSLQNAAKFCPNVFHLFQKLDPSAADPQPWLWVRCAEFLLRNNHQTEKVMKSLPKAGRHAIGDAAVLALEYAPTLARNIFRRALRSKVPANRCTAAAALAILDLPWSRQELLAATNESTDHELTAECRAALAESRDPAVRQAAREWEEKNPREPETGDSISAAEMMIRGAPDRMMYEMDKLREKVLALRDREPPA